MRKHIYRLVAIGALVTLILVLWLNTEVTSAGTHEASVVLAESNAKITLRLQPMHPYLAEYRRFLVLQVHNGDQRSIELQPDTGGFARTQIYLLPAGRIALQGYLDVAIASSSPPDLKRIEEVPDGGKYIGAFDKDKEGEWRFMSAKDSAEQQLVATGGYLSLAKSLRPSELNNDYAVRSPVPRAPARNPSPQSVITTKSLLNFC